MFFGSTRFTQAQANLGLGFTMPFSTEFVFLLFYIVSQKFHNRIVNFPGLIFGRMVSRIFEIKGTFFHLHKKIQRIVITKVMGGREPFPVGVFERSSDGKAIGPARQARTFPCRCFFHIPSGKCDDTPPLRLHLTGYPP